MIKLILLLGGLPVFIASFFYPMGNQLVWEAKNGDHRNTFNNVFLMSK